MVSYAQEVNSFPPRSLSNLLYPDFSFRADNVGFTVRNSIIYNYFKTCIIKALFVFSQTFVSQEYLNGRSDRVCESSKAEGG